MCWAGALWSGVRPLVTCRPWTLGAQQQPLGWRWAHTEDSKRHRKITIICSCMAVFRFGSLCATSMDSVFWTWITKPCPEWWWQERALLCWKSWNYWNDSCYDKNNCIWVVLLFICWCSHKYTLLWWVICSILMVDAYKNLIYKFISLTLGINVEYYMT